MKELNYIKEIFIQKFCKQKGWDPKNLTTNKVLIIEREFKRLNS